MNPSTVRILTLTDLEEKIRLLERTYGLATADFLCKKGEVPEDDSLKWDAYVNQRRRLVETHREVRRTYLPGPGESVAYRPGNDVELAA